MLPVVVNIPLHWKLSLAKRNSKPLKRLAVAYIADLYSYFSR